MPSFAPVGQVVALLGPTNTGKTHRAIERMLSHRSGMIGLPLRLLAREGFALAVLPSIAVRDELASGALIEADSLPGLTETFFAVTIGRRFPNPIVRSLLDGADGIFSASRGGFAS